MTAEQKRAAIRALINRHTVANTVNQRTAKESLIKEGIYTKKGKLRVEFGGSKEANESEI